MIDGVTSNTYTLTNNDVDKFIFFEVTPIASTGKITGETVVSVATNKIENNIQPTDGRFQIIQGNAEYAYFITSYHPTTPIINGTVVLEGDFVWTGEDQILYNGWKKISDLSNAVLTNGGKTLTLSNVNTNTEIRPRANVNIAVGTRYQLKFTVDADGSGENYTPVSHDFFSM